MQTPEDVVDTIYAMKQTSALLDDLKKEINKFVELAEKIACGLWLRTGDGQPIRTQYCIGIPDVKQVPKTPKEGTPEYEAFLKHFGVPLDAPFKAHWPKMLERIAEDMAEGRPLPAGCDPSETWPVFKVSTRKKKPVLDSDDALQDADLLKERQALLQAFIALDKLGLQKILGMLDRRDELYAESDKRTDVPAASPETPENPF